MTWGAAVSGGDCYAMQQLKKCSRFKPLTVLLLGDGSVVTCGAADGGDCSAVQGKPVSSSSLTAKKSQVASFVQRRVLVFYKLSHTWIHERVGPYTLNSENDGAIDPKLPHN